MINPKPSNSRILNQHFGEGILYLYNTEYAFCNERLQLVNFPFYLHDHLTQFDYETIVFYNAKKGIHVLPFDQKSADHLTKIYATLIQANQPKGPTRLQQVAQTQQAQENPSGDKTFLRIILPSKSTTQTGEQPNANLKYIKGQDKLSLPLGLEQLDHLVNRANETYLRDIPIKAFQTGIKQHKIAIVIDFDSLMTVASEGDGQAGENTILKILSNWNDKTYIREDTTIFIVINGADPEMNIRQKVLSYEPNQRARLRMSKLPPLQMLMNRDQDIQQTLHRTIVNIPSLPSRGELVNYLYRLRMLDLIDFSPTDVEDLADVLFYYSRPHSYFDQKTRTYTEYNQAYSLHAIHQRFMANLAQLPSNEKKITIDLLKDQFFKVTMPKSGIDQLNDLIGLTEIKERIALEKVNLEKKNAEKKGQSYYYVSRLMEDVKNNVGKGTKGTLSFLFLGNPGTGKSTVGNILGQIYKELGLVTSGHLVKENAGKLKSRYVGEAAVNLNNLVKKADGGVLFIDEIAGIVSSDENKSTINEINSGILTATDETDNLVTVVAGYPKETEAYLESDPGLRSRFNSDNTFIFKDYSGPDLAKIFEKEVKKRSDLDKNKPLTLDYALKQLLPKMMTVWYRTYMDLGLKGWGNGRTVRDLFESIMKRKIQRNDDGVLSLKDFDIRFKEIDFKEIIKECQNQELSPMAELEALVGIQPVKQLIATFERQAKLGLPIPRFYTFYGAAGTGKKTTAKIFGKLLEAWKLTHEHAIETIDYYKLIQEIQKREANPSGLFKGKQKKLIIISGIDDMYQNTGNVQDYQLGLKSLFADMDDFKGYYLFILDHKHEEKFSRDFARFFRTSQKVLFPNLSANDVMTLLFRKITDNDFHIDENSQHMIKANISQLINAFPNDHNTDLVEQIYLMLSQAYTLRISELHHDEVEQTKVFTVEDVERMLQSLPKEVA